MGSRVRVPYTPQQTFYGTLTEWLGSGLQNRVQQFESAGYLSRATEFISCSFCFILRKKHLNLTLPFLLINSYVLIDRLEKSILNTDFADWTDSLLLGQRIFPVGMMGKALAHIRHIE